MLALISAVESSAQENRELNTRHLFWTCLLGEYKLTSSWSAWVDAQFRYEYTDGDIFQWCVRPSATWKSKKGLLLSPGVSYWQLYPNPNGAAPRPEFRPWQEIGYKFKPNAHHVIYPRARFEQRFIREYEGAELADNYSFHSYRLRLRIDYTYSFGSESEPSPFFLIAGNEFFVYQKTNGFSAFDQNRAWAGIGYKFNSNHNIQVSYLYLYQQRNSAGADQFHVPRILYQFALASKPKEDAK
jgi:hypothetical protein